jgi:hypothetical protein
MNLTKTALTALAGATALAATLAQAQAQSTSDALIDKLEKKGILTADEARDLRKESATADTNLVSSVSASKLKIPDSFKNIQIFGDLRFRYEYRAADNVAGAADSTFTRERFRYALRVGIRGDLFDDFSYGIRLETANNPRSPWNTLGNNTTAGAVTPSDKNAAGIYLGQAYLAWHPNNWFEMTGGRMPQPLYTTPMVWDSDINPEGAFEKIKYSVDNVDLFAGFGQFVYFDPTSTSSDITGDTAILAWQVGGNVKLGHDMSFKVAPLLYTYVGEGHGNANGLGGPFVGQGGPTGNNPGIPGGPSQAALNQEGINDLLILEVPAEFNFDIGETALGKLHGRFFGDFSYNFDGNDRATAAFNANPAAFPTVTGPVTGENKAYQVGFGIGNAGPTYGPTQGLVYGSTSKANTWEARVYWQHVEQYALDVNLLDSDFFEGRANLQGIYTAFAYSFTDHIIGTVRYGHADRINDNLGTGGNNLDIPGINPIKNYNLFQLDVTWRF